MKVKKALAVLTLFIAQGYLYGQVGVNIHPNPGGDPEAEVGIGISTPEASLHVHDLDEKTIEADDGEHHVRTPGKSLNAYGISNILLTNIDTDVSATDGFKIETKGLNASLINQEGRRLNFFTGTSRIFMDGGTGRVHVGILSNSSDAKFNVFSNDGNGMFIRTIQPNKYGLKVRVREDDDDAIQVFGSDNDKEFAVKGGGSVFARKYTTTLNSIPDYVFEEDYDLMPLDLLEQFVQTEKHLPNVPSEADYKEAGSVDIGELTRLLLEKTEENTLYILELKKEIEALKQENAALKENCIKN